MHSRSPPLISRESRTNRWLSGRDLVRSLCPHLDPRRSAQESYHSFPPTCRGRSPRIESTCKSCRDCRRLNSKRRAPPRRSLNESETSVRIADAMSAVPAVAGPVQVLARLCAGGDHVHPPRRLRHGLGRDQGAAGAERQRPRLADGRVHGGYGLFEMPWGFLGDRLGVRNILAVVILGGSALTAALPLVVWLPPEVARGPASAPGLAVRLRCLPGRAPSPRSRG